MRFSSSWLSEPLHSINTVPREDKMTTDGITVAGVNECWISADETTGKCKGLACMAGTGDSSFARTPGPTSMMTRLLGFNVSTRRVGDPQPLVAAFGRK